jgi:uncharacterized damage-inducible protein DinB
MTVEDLQRLYDYGYWANGKLLQVVAQLTPDEFTRSVGGSYGSVQSTLVHALSAEWGWLGRCGGPERGPALKPEDYPTVEPLVGTWARVEGDMREFLAKLTADALGRAVEFTTPRGETRSIRIGETLQHAAIHGVHHRGQVALLLRVLGRTPGNFDMLLYDVEKTASRP